MALTHTQVVEYIRSLEIASNSDYYDIVNKLLLLSNSVYNRLMEKLVNPSSGMTIDDLIPLAEINDYTITVKLDLVDAGGVQVIQFRKDLLSEMNASGLNDAMKKYISGVALSTTPDPLAFQKYLAYSQQRGDRFVVYKKVDELGIDSEAFRSYSDLTTLFNRITKNPWGFGKPIVENTYVELKAAYDNAFNNNPYLSVPYNIQRDNVQSFFQLPSTIVETLKIPSNFRSKDFIPRVLSDVYHYGSPNIWNKTLSEFVNRVVEMYIDNSYAISLQDCAKEICFGVNGYMNDNSVWDQLKSLIAQFEQTTPSSSWNIPWVLKPEEEILRVYDINGNIIIPSSVLVASSTTVTFREETVGTIVILKKVVNFVNNFWRVQILRYYIPSIPYILKSPFEEMSLITELNKIDSTKASLDQIRDLVSLLSTKLETVLIPQNL